MLFVAVHLVCCIPCCLVQVLQREGVLAYTSLEEGEITATRLAQLPDDVEADRVQFIQVHFPNLRIFNRRRDWPTNQ